MAFGKTLSNLRRSKGLSQEQLAEALDLTRQTISKWELDQSTPDIDYLLRLSNFFGVSTDYLIKGEQETLTAHDKTNSESSGIEQGEIKANNAIAFKWCFYLGTVFAGVSLIGIIAFVICSALHPWTAMWNNGKIYEGVLGFLIGTNTLWFFIILCALLVVGLILSVYGIIKNMNKINH